MEFTGERYMPQVNAPEISLEHWHRYLWATQFTAEKTVLDIACGEGYGSNFLAGAAARVVGIDADPEAVRYASQTYARPNLSFQCGAAQAIPIAGEQVFDVIVSFETIEHLTRAHQTAFLAEIARLLKKDGVALLSTPDKLVYSDRPNYRNRFHLDEFYQDDYTDFLEQSFANVELFGQKIYAASHLWPLDHKRRYLREFQLDFAAERFVPSNDDRKETMYLVAVCRHTARDASDASVLLDVAERILQPQCSQPADPTADAIPLRFSIDTVDGVDVVHGQSQPVVISAHNAFEVRGWAMDAGANAPVARASLVIDGAMEVEAVYGIGRPDLAAAFGPTYANGGFRAAVAAHSLASGRHRIATKCVASDGKTAYLLPKEVEVAIVQRATGHARSARGRRP